MTAAPWLSVVVPTYNGARYIREALSSIVAQNCRPNELQVLVADDGSTDATPDIVLSYESRLNIELFRCQHRGNWVTMTNIALAQARGEYLSILHQDDFWLPDRFAQLQVAAQRSPAAVLLVHPVHFVDAGGRRIGQLTCPFSKNVPLGTDDVFERLLVQNFIACCAPLFRADAIQRVGLLDERLWYAADWDYWLKLASIGQTIYCGKPLAAFRVHPDAQTVVATKDSFDVMSQFAVIFKRHLYPWQSAKPYGSRVAQMSLFSANLNLALLRIHHGEKGGILQLGDSFIRLGPRGWQSFLRNSRIVERLMARMRASPRLATVPLDSATVGVLPRASGN